MSENLILDIVGGMAGVCTVVLLACIALRTRHIELILRKIEITAGGNQDKLLYKTEAEALSRGAVIERVKADAKAASPVQTKLVIVEAEKADVHVKSDRNNPEQ